jgi:hypothetical protein
VRGEPLGVDGAIPLGLGEDAFAGRDASQPTSVPLQADHQRNDQESGFDRH